MMRLLGTLLLTALFGAASLAEAQTHQGVMTVERSPAGSTQVRYFIDSTLCNFGGPLGTQTTPVPGGWQITTDLFIANFCNVTPGPPATLIVDLGYLRQGQYTVIWSFSGGIGYGTRSATFTIAQDQAPVAIPTLSRSVLIVLALIVGVLTVLILKRRAQG